MAVAKDVDGIVAGNMPLPLECWSTKYEYQMYELVRLFDWKKQLLKSGERAY